MRFEIGDIIKSKDHALDKFYGLAFICRILERDIQYFEVIHQNTGRNVYLYSSVSDIELYTNIFRE
jgi:hypothetical protein